MSKWKKLRADSFQLGGVKVYWQGPGDWVLQFDGREVGAYLTADDAMRAGERMAARFSAAPRKRAAKKAAP